MATVTPLRIGPADQGRRLTLAEFLDADVEEGYRYELARGVVEVTHVPRPSHGMIVWMILGLIRDFERNHAGRIWRAGGGGEFRFWLPGLVSGRNPDVAVILEGAVRDGRGQHRPALAMEIVSEGEEAHERDHVTKREEYLAYGLDEYWIVDPIERRVRVLTRDGDAWAEAAFVAGQEAEGRVLPGFRVPVAELWAAYEKGRADD